MFPFLEDIVPQPGAGHLHALFLHWNLVPYLSPSAGVTSRNEPF